MERHPAMISVISVIYRDGWSELHQNTQENCQRRRVAPYEIIKKKLSETRLANNLVFFAMAEI